jgi:hypothetical protein
MATNAPRARRVPLLLQPADYEALSRIADREERTVSQQAAYILRRSLATKDAGHDPAGTRSTSGTDAA